MMREEIVIKPERDGAKRVVLMVDSEEASWCWIVPFTIRVGCATVRMDGIGGVETKPEHRLKGYARRVLWRSVEEMSVGDAGITMLYGIRDFYHRFGYVTAGPEYWLFLYNVQAQSPLPAGWSVREFTAQDLSAVQRIYEEATALSTGVAVRSAQSPVWHRLLETPGSYPQDECWVAVSPAGEIAGYLWRARWCWSIRDILEREFPDALCFGEAIALTSGAASALLAFCRRRAREEGKEEVLLPVPPDTVLANTARFTDCRMVQMYSANGNSMVRLLDAFRLLKALEPELSRQARLASGIETRELTLCTDAGEATLRVSAEGVVVTAEAEGLRDRVMLPQGTLARMALGFAPAGELCAQLDTALPAEVVALLEKLFPVRFGHMYLPDRY